MRPPPCCSAASWTFSLTSEYRAALLVGNQLTERGSREQVRTETSRITIRGAVVDVQDFKGNSLKSFSTDATGFVDPATGSTPSYGVVYVKLIPSSLNLAANTQVTVQVHVYGDTLGGRSIESNDLTFPITTCAGCLVDFPAGAFDPANPGAGCTGDPGSATAPCFFGQDDPVDCRLCTTNPACVPPA